MLIMFIEQITRKTKGGTARWQVLSSCYTRNRLWPFNETQNARICWVETLHLILHEGRFKNTLVTPVSLSIGPPVSQSFSQLVRENHLALALSAPPAPFRLQHWHWVWPAVAHTGLGNGANGESDVRRGAKWPTGWLLYILVYSYPCTIRIAGNIIKSDVCLAFVALESCVVCCDYKTLMSASTLPNEWLAVT